MVDAFVRSLFWVCMGMTIYTYVGYPALLWGISQVYRRPVRKGTFEPSISIIISAFNEESSIERKLLNLLDLDYPADKLEILIGSDGASDRTDEIVARFHSTRIRFFRFVSNFGKPHVLSALVKEAHGEIIIFSDARQELDPNAVRTLAANFNDPNVGCVSGELYLRASDQNALGSIGGGMDAYWRYEKFLRKRESEIGSMLGATGAIYAIRRSLFPSYLPPDVLVDDMYIPFEVISQGYRAIFDPESRAYDRFSVTGQEEFKRKVRTLAGNYQIFSYFPKLFIPYQSPIAWQLFSHKFLRLMVPFFLFGILAANLFLLNHPFYRLVLMVQLLFYGLAGFEAVQAQARHGKKGLGYLPYTFCLLNYSAVVGLVQFLSGSQKPTWGKAYA